MRKFFVPPHKYNLVDILKDRYSRSWLQKQPKKRLYAIYFKAMEGNTDAGSKRRKESTRETFRNVIERLNDVFGLSWSFDVTSLDTDEGDCFAVKGLLTVPNGNGGFCSRSDVGISEPFSMPENKGDVKKYLQGREMVVKGAVSDALKRAAVHFGVGKYLYELPDFSVGVDNNGYIEQSHRDKIMSVATPILEGNGSKISKVFLRDKSVGFQMLDGTWKNKPLDSF